MNLVFTMLEARRLTIWRGERRLCRDLSFSLAPGSLLLLQGRNGSGKTSLLRCLAGLLPLESGTVELNGIAFRRDPARYLRCLGWLGHKDGLKTELSARRNLAFRLRLAGLAGKAGKEDELLERAGLKGLGNRAASQLSFGQRRRLALAGLIGAAPPVWLLDEPDANLDAQGREWLQRELNSHLDAGGCAVLAGHRMEWRVRGPAPQLILGIAR